MVDDSIYERLSTFGPLVELIGDHIWSVEVPSDSLPVEQADWSGIVYYRISDVPTVDLDGSVNLNQARFQLSCLSNIDHRTARQIAIQARAALQGYVGGEIVFATYAFGGMDLFEADTTREHHVPIDFLITYRVEQAF